MQAFSGQTLLATGREDALTATALRRCREQRAREAFSGEIKPELGRSSALAPATVRSTTLILAVSTE